MSKLIINPMTTMFENKKIRTVSVDNKVYFIAKDVAETLAYKNPQEAIRNSCVDARSLDEIIDFVRGSENLTLLETLNIGLKGKKIKVIQQNDILRLIVKSKLPQARKFERWVFDEVLPSILETGSYSTNQQSSLSHEDIKAISSTLIDLAPKSKKAISTNDDIKTALNIATSHDELKESQRVQRARYFDKEIKQITIEIARLEEDKVGCFPELEEVIQKNIDSLYDKKIEIIETKKLDSSNYKTKSQKTRKESKAEKALRVELELANKNATNKESELELANQKIATLESQLNKTQNSFNLYVERINSYTREMNQYIEYLKTGRFTQPQQPNFN